MVHQLREPQVAGDVSQPLRRPLVLVERGAAGGAHRGGGVQGAVRVVCQVARGAVLCLHGWILVRFLKEWHDGNDFQNFE